MGVCGTSEAERAQAAAAEAAAQALAESKIQLEIDSDDSRQQGSTTTAYGLETAGELLKRLAPQLELPESRWMELSLEFSDVTVPHDRVLQEAAIREVREYDIASGVDTDECWCLTGSDCDGAGREEDPCPGGPQATYVAWRPCNQEILRSSLPLYKLQ